MTQKVSIVIPTKNAGDLFRDVLRGLKNQAYTGLHEILIIDSGSSDRTVELAKDFGARVHTIRPEEFNHGSTRNLGIGMSTGDIIVLLTQDAVPGDKNMIVNLVSAFEDPKVGGAYARQVPRTKADVLTKRNIDNSLAGRKESEVKWIKNKKEYDAMSPMEKYYFCNFDNVCSAVRREVWQEFNFSHSDFGEDIDWGMRILEGGWKIAYQASAFVIHSHDRSILYEYKRTYMCHRKLFQQFGLHTVPTFRHVLRFIILSTAMDFKYVIQNSVSHLEQFRLLVRLPFMNIASVLGQYIGARDERLGLGKKKTGV